MTGQIKLGDCESSQHRILDIYIYIQNNRPNEKQRFGTNYIEDAMQLNIYLYYNLINFKNMGGLFSIYSSQFGCSGGDRVFVEVKTLNVE